MNHLPQSKISLKQLYEDDFLLWIDETIKQLKQRNIEQIDWDNLIEEIEDLGREQRRKGNSFLRQIFVHFLMYQYWTTEKTYCGNGWKGEISTFRAELEELIDSKTLLNYLIQEFNKTYVKARKIVVNKTGLPDHIFPETCPYTLDQVLDTDFFPD